MGKTSYNVAVDGPSGAGKSTICKAIASRLDLTYVDTGAMYRAIAYGMILHHVDVNDESAVKAGLTKCHLDYDENHQLCLNGVPLHEEIRSEMVSLSASTVARYEAVRNYCVALQQQIAKNGGCIMDGRDIGTVVLPDAQVKIFLTADVSVRANRRFLQNEQKGIECSYEQVLEDVKKRDLQDTTRKHSPLIQAKDAIYVDSSTMDFDTTVNTLVEIIVDTVEKKGDHD